MCVHGTESRQEQRLEHAVGCSGHNMYRARLLDGDLAEELIYRRRIRAASLRSELALPAIVLIVKLEVKLKFQPHEKR